MHDGVVMYTTASLTEVLGFPKDMWLGRSFIDFVHPKDRISFASHITSGVAAPQIGAKGQSQYFYFLETSIFTALKCAPHKISVFYNRIKKKNTCLFLFIFTFTRVY
jgi:PAS fold